MSINKIDITQTLAEVEKLLRKDKKISPQVRAMMKLLVVVINLLIGKLKLNSRNSSKPPSQDANRKRGSRQKTDGKKRKPGGQPGRDGKNLQKIENPDKVETLEIDRRTIPPGNYKVVGFESRQVIDIQISRHVTEYRAEILEDEKGNQFVADFPEEITRPVQYGASVKAQAVYMSQQQLIPYDRIGDYFDSQCSIPISTGSIFNFNKEAYDLLLKFDDIAKNQLISSSVLHADETGVNVNGKRLWLHSASNNFWTYFFVHKKRGTDAMENIGILDNFNGVLCHDHWKPYFKFECLHALCNAHHLRELEYAWNEDKQKWAKRMQKLLLEMKERTEKSGGCLSDKAAKRFLKRYRRILAEADKECPPANNRKGKRGRVANTKSRNLLERLREYETETLRFMTDKDVPFTNNLSENDIRMTKVQQKISGCFRSMEGAQFFCRIRAYLSTCRKHGVAPTEALQTLFSGKLPDFMKKLE